MGWEKKSFEDVREETDLLYWRRCSATEEVKGALQDPALAETQGESTKFKQRSGKG